MHPIRLGTRGSALALWQANHVKELLLQHYPEISFKIITIKTEGDRDRNSSLTVIGGEGVFTKEIEMALSNNKIDVAIHSLKDLPSSMPDSLMLAAVPERGPIADVLITANGVGIDDLPRRARVATGSVRRRSLLLHARPDLKMCDLRGNILTRIKKLSKHNYDAIIMAKAALVRLKLLKTHHHCFSIEQMIPSVGQGAIGLQTRVKDTRVIDLVRTINHEPTFQAVTAERAFLERLESGCQFPVGANARADLDTLNMIGFVGDINGRHILIESIQADLSNATEAGEQLAEILINKGALALIKQAYHN